MFRSWSRAVLIIALFLSPAAPVFAGGYNLAQYPLRVHIFQRTEQAHSSRQTVEWVEGEGKADLFEGGGARGFDFGFHCGGRLMTSSGFETYPARWKTEGRLLEILLPVMGKPDAMNSCELKVAMKDFAYYRKGGNLSQEPAAAFKEWMEKHQYDPQKGKTQPVNLGAGKGPVEQ